MVEENDLGDLMREEKGRGRKQPRAALQQRRIRMFLRAWPRLIEEGDPQKFAQGLTELGFEEDSVEWQRAFELWRERWRP